MAQTLEEGRDLGAMIAAMPTHRGRETDLAGLGPPQHRRAIDTKQRGDLPRREKLTRATAGGRSRVGAVHDFPGGRLRWGA